MSYIQERYTVEQFIAERSKAQENIAKSALSQLDRFSMEQYQVSGLQLFEDLGKEQNESKTFLVLNQFIAWLQEEHPEIMIPFGKMKCQRPFKPLHSRTIKNYIKALKNILDDCFGLVFNERQFKRKVRYPQIENFDPDPLTKEELKLIMEYASRSKRVLYMTLKDSGMRIGEAISRALDYEPNKFLDWYEAKINSGLELQNETSPLIPFLNEQKIVNQWIQVKNFYHRFNEYADLNHFDKGSRNFPKTAQRLRAYLIRVKPLLDQNNYKVEFKHNTEDNEFTKGSTILRFSRKNIQSSLGDAQ